MNNKHYDGIENESVTAPNRHKSKLLNNTEYDEHQNESVTVNRQITNKIKVTNQVFVYLPAEVSQASINVNKLRLE